MSNQDPRRLGGGVPAAAAVLAALCVSTASAQGKIQVTLQDAPLTIMKNNSTTRKIVGIPNGTPGSLDLKIKWHVMSFVPNVFNKLTIELLRGSTVLQTKSCYSVHSGKDPKCYVFDAVTQAEADAAGDWKLRITNNSNEDVNGFNIQKENTDINPTVSSVGSTFESSCAVRYLGLQGAPFAVAPHSTTTRDLFMILDRAGDIRIRAKWHTDVVAPNSFRRLKFVLLRGGSVVHATYGYSIHSNESNKLDLKYHVSAGQSGNWQLRVTNEEPFSHKSFDIEKGSEINPILSKTDLNPFVPEFKSTYKPSC